MLALTRVGRVATLASGLCVPPLAVAAAEIASRPFVLHVSPDGDDRWSGRRAEPDASRTDGPLATLQRARDFLREHRRGGDSRARRRRCAFRVAGTGCPSRSFSRRRTPARPPGRPPPARHPF